MLDGQYICIFILSLNRFFCLLVPDESFLDIQSKSYILYISNKIWFVCQAIPRRIYKISHINFLPFHEIRALVYCVIVIMSTSFHQTDHWFWCYVCFRFIWIRGDMIDLRNWMGLVSISIIFYGIYQIYHIDVLWAIVIEVPIK